MSNKDPNLSTNLGDSPLLPKVKGKARNELSPNVLMLGSRCVESVSPQKSRQSVGLKLRVLPPRTGQSFIVQYPMKVSVDMIHKKRGSPNLQNLQNLQRTGLDSMAKEIREAVEAKEARLAKLAKMSRETARESDVMGNRTNDLSLKLLLSKTCC